MQRQKFGDPQIREVLKKKHRSAGWLADSCGESSAHVRNANAGRCPPNKNYVVKASILLDTPAEKLFTPEGLAAMNQRDAAKGKS